jgi:hypothetical protein
MSLVKRDWEAHEQWRVDAGRVCELCEEDIALVPEGVTATMLEDDPDSDWGFDAYCENCQHKLNLIARDD